MAKQSLATIKSWFKRGAKPTAAQFASVFDSFFHKDESIPQSNISELGTTITALETLISKNKQITIQQEYDGLVNKDSGTVYFCADTGNLYLGQVPLFEPDAFTSATLGNDGIVTFTRHGNGASTTFTLDMNPLLVQPDWNQNDSEERDYVKNRTHYEDTIEMTSFEKQVGESTIDFNWETPPTAGNTYYLNVLVNGNPYHYEAVARAESETETHIDFRYESGYIGTFYYLAGPSTFGDEGTNGRWSGNPQISSVELLECIELKKLDEKYLPESIARKSELSNVARTGDYDDLTNKPSIPDAESMVTAHNTSADAHNDIRQIALGASRGTSFQDIQSLVSALNAAAVDAYRVGDNLYIDTLDVADLWIAAVDSTNVPYTYTSDNDFGTAVAAGRVQIGYFFVSRLEGGKVNIDLATHWVNGMMSAGDKAKLDGIVHGACRVGADATMNSGGVVIGSLYIWNRVFENYSSPDSIIQFRIPLIKIGDAIMGIDNDFNFDITGPLTGVIHNIITERLTPIIRDMQTKTPTKDSGTTLVAGGFNDLGVLTDDVTLSLPAVTAGTAPEFNGQFTVDANGAFSVTFPTGIVMDGDTNLVAGGVYQFSICNGFGVIIKMA